MPNKKNCASNKWLIALALTAAVLMPIGSHAFIVEVDETGTNATRILGLEVDGSLYNVDFLWGRWVDIYEGADFDFTNCTDACSANLAVIVALNDVNDVVTVGPEAKTEYNIPLGLTFVPGPPGQPWTSKVLTVAGHYDDPVWLQSTGGADQPVVTWAKFTVVPLPAAVWLLASGLIGLWGLRRRLKN